VKTKERVLK